MKDKKIARTFRLSEDSPETAVEACRTRRNHQDGNSRSPYPPSGDGRSMSTVRCRCGKTKNVRRHGHRFTCLECSEARRKEVEATAVEIKCAGCGQTRRVRLKQFNKCQPCDGFMCGMFGCKQIPGKPEPPLQQLIGWHRRTGWELNGGFYSYSFHRDTVEDIAACWRACEIRDAAIAQARGF